MVGLSDCAQGAWGRICCAEIEFHGVAPGIRHCGDGAQCEEICKAGWQARVGWARARRDFWSPYSKSALSITALEVHGAHGQTWTNGLAGHCPRRLPTQPTQQPTFDIHVHVHVPLDTMIIDD